VLLFKGPDRRYALRSAEERFFDKVEITEGGCWIWRGAKDRAGYGFFSVGGKLVRVHRWAYEHFKGPIPEGKVLDHYKCQTPSCTNPDHTEPVTDYINSLRSSNPNFVAHREGRCMRGHEFTEENTIKDRRGRKRCRICQNEWNKAAAKRKRAENPKPPKPAPEPKPFKHTVFVTHETGVCQRGHALTPDNTYNKADGTKQCKACHRMKDQERRLRRQTGLAA
jgi:hypothetical protein